MLIKLYYIEGPNFYYYLGKDAARTRKSQTWNDEYSIVAQWVTTTHGTTV